MSDLDAVAARIAADIDHIRDRLNRAVAELRRAQPGIRSVPTDTAGGPGGGDGVHQAAMARSADPSVRALADLTDWLLAAEQRTRSARIIVDVWTARPTGSGASHGDPGCQWMSRHGGPWEEARYSLDVGGVRLRVGQRVWRWHRDTGELPGADVVTAWAQGRRPKRRVQPGAGDA